MKAILKLILICIGMTFFTATLFAQAKNVKIDELEKIINTKGDKILVLNLWATFCKPCVEEIPSFVTFAKEHSEVDLVFVSLDMKEAYPKTVNKYIQKLGMTGTNLWLDETDADYFVPKIDDKWSGALPATLIINTETGARKFVDGEMSEKELNEVFMTVSKV